MHTTIETEKIRPEIDLLREMAFILLKVRPTYENEGTKAALPEIERALDFALVWGAVYFKET